MYALIMAGGVGSRLWPKSRKATPKQFLNLTGQETMIQRAVKRLEGLTTPDHIFIATGQQYVSLVAEQLPMLPKSNIIAEISGKNTAPAIGLGALHIDQVDPEATMAVLTADHIIPNEVAFQAALRTAESVAQQGKVVTLGITPTGPETGYGYIKRGETIGTYQGQTVYNVEQFLEKPDLQKAQDFYNSGEYYWNSGMFIWQTSTLFQALQQHMPQLFEQLQALKQALFTNSKRSVEEIWGQVEAESIDVGLMEKVNEVAVVPLDAGWNDVGSWRALYDELAKTDGENIVVNANHLAIDSTGLLIQGNNQLITTIGVDNLVIVQTKDALLICDRNNTQAVKNIVNQLKSTGKEIYL